MRVFLASLLIASAPAYTAKIYKCLDANGRPTFSQKPCSNDAEKIEVHTPQPATNSTESYFVDLASRGRIARGMTTAQAQMSWGPPTKINRSNYTGVTKEQWVYRRTSSVTQYLYFENGILTGWSD